MFRLAVVAVMLTVSVSAQAQQPGDTLRTCLADSTSGKDRKDLAKWIFLSIAAHPEMKRYASDNAATAADQSSRTIGVLVTRLLTDSCVNETRAVMQIGASQSIEVAFAGLGQLAMQELMADKSVKESMGLFERYLDHKRFTDVLAGK
jgi:hypothetical protein